MTEHKTHSLECRQDVNAAVNIKNFALRNYVSGTDTKTRNELSTLVGVLTSEAQPIASGVGGQFTELFGFNKTKKNIETIVDRCEEKLNSDIENRHVWIEVLKFWKKKLNGFDLNFKK